MSRRGFLVAAVAAARSLAATKKAPAPYGALPSGRQLQWQELELCAFLHFSINTFTDREWGYGDENPALFNPTSFDAEAIVTALKAADMKGVILTCKHHDGFCLWPTRTTDHSIRRSPWRRGEGDVVRELSQAARAAGLKFGVYLSPWDRNSALYGKPAYPEMYRTQLRELLTGYGEIFEVWFDGANGGDGYYGGAREKRVIDRRTYYDWPQNWEIVRSLQPGAVIFSDVGPDVRWVGNEKGDAGETCWATYDPVGEDGGPAAPGYVRSQDSEAGTRHGSRWMPAECDVSIRPGWFWHAAEDARVKTPEELMKLYDGSVGHGAGLLLNVPPDRRGLLHESDVTSLQSFGQQLRTAFANNLATAARPVTATVRARDDDAFGPRNLIDGDRYTYWSTDDAATTPEVVLEFDRPVRFDLVRLRENIRLGQRVEAFALDHWQDGAWKTFAQNTSIGSCRLIRTSPDVSTNRVRLRITQCPVCPAISEFALYTRAN
ncbi:MAG TPA: alpha-L-fucosidase [Terriglobia bacterium]|nr:alpha-L-fucosidase [Terriglobia bacterium]